ncbi:MAG: hypothetical protein DWQ05_12065 [Calditrichaeota bacterium]|nr:MAG: hypothetical protein DWQ05_12065 [Calditrichota bacterium]
MNAQKITNRSIGGVCAWLQATARNQRCYLVAKHIDRIDISHVENYDDSQDCLRTLMKNFHNDNYALPVQIEDYILEVEEIIEQAKAFSLLQLDYRERELINYTTARLTTSAELQSYLGFSTIDALKSYKKRAYANFRELMVEQIERKLITIEDPFLRDFIEYILRYFRDPDTRTKHFILNC